MTKDEHATRHKELHEALDELLADFITHTKLLPSKTSVKELLNWSYKQGINPTEVT